MSYQDWLAQRFGGDPVPKRDLDRARGALGWDELAFERLFNSYNNDTFMVTNDSGDRAFVRIARTHHDRFYRERWALEVCANARVPVPRCIAVIAGQPASGLFPVSVLDFIDAEPLDALAGRLPPERIADVLRATGRALAAVHSIRPDVNDAVVADEDEHPDLIRATQIVQAHDDLCRIGLRIGVAEELVKRGVHALEGVLGHWNPPLQLVHGDFGAKHALVDCTGALRAIVDFETATAGDGAGDLAFWDYGLDDGEATRHLLEGYAEVAEARPPKAVLALHRILISFAYITGYGATAADVPEGFFATVARELQGAVDDIDQAL